MGSQGKRLKEIRLSLRLNQQQLADKLGIKYQSVGKAEKNINKLSNESLSHLINKCNVNLNYLVAGIGEMFITKD